MKQLQTSLLHALVCAYGTQSDQSKGHEVDLGPKVARHFALLSRIYNIFAPSHTYAMLTDSGASTFHADNAYGVKFGRRTVFMLENQCWSRHGNLQECPT